MSSGCDPEVAEYNIALTPDEQVCWLDVSMDESFIMDVLEGAGNLLDVGDDPGEWNTCATGIALAQSAFGCVLHDDERNALVFFNAEVEELHNVGVFEEKDLLDFVDEFLLDEPLRHPLGQFQ